MLRALGSELPCVAALLACAVGVFVTCLGAAPVSRLSVHVAAAAFGFAAYALLRRRLGQGDFRRDVIVVSFALFMLVLTVLATALDGVQHWFTNAGLQVQSSELLSPLLLVIAAGLVAREHAIASGVVLLLVALVQFLAPDLDQALAWAAGATALLAASEHRNATRAGIVCALGLCVIGTWLRVESGSARMHEGFALAPLSFAQGLAVGCLLLVALLLMLAAFGFAPALVSNGTHASQLAGLALCAYFVVHVSSAFGSLQATVLGLSPWLGAGVGLVALRAQVRAERRLQVQATLLAD